MIPKGRQTVPKVLTLEMLRAATNSWNNDQGPKSYVIHGSEIEDMWRAMLAVAPSPGNRHTDRSVPCPTCGFVVHTVEPRPFVIEDDEPSPGKNGPGEEEIARELHRWLKWSRPFDECSKDVREDFLAGARAVLRLSGEG